MRPGAGALLGEGVFIMTIDQGPDMDRYQGVTPIEGETLALCAETYFAQSEQTPTRVRLAVGTGRYRRGHRDWRAGGLLIQNIAEDEARGSTDEAWDRGPGPLRDRGRGRTDRSRRSPARDPAVAPVPRGRRAHVPAQAAERPSAAARTSGSPSVLASFAPDERAAMVEADGRIRVTCEYCARDYVFTPEDAA